MNNIPIYVINLEKSIERRASIKQELTYVASKPCFVTALDGHDQQFPFNQYKHLSGVFWERKNEFKPGAFACYLSHAKAWEKVVNGSQSYAMVLEDDVKINTQAFFDFSIDDCVNNFDVIFISQHGVRLLAKRENKENFTCVSILLMELALDVENKGNIVAPGTYGYIISKKGAKKLLSMMSSRKISMGVDYAMLFNSLSSIDIKRLISLSESELPIPLDIFVKKEREHRSSGDTAIELISYIYTLEPIVEIKEFSSDIKHSVFFSNDIFNTT